MTLPHENGIRTWLQATGGIVIVLLLTQFFTGVLLAFYYVPSVDHAYQTVSYIEKVVSSGSWIRSVHHYGSQWLSVFLFLHVVQLFATGAYVSRRVQWIASILLLGLIMAAGGTGYSLPWDARAFFSTRVAEGLMSGLPLAGRMARLWLLGGSDISTLTLSRFFALHVLLIPALIVAVVAWRARAVNVFGYRHAITGAIVFAALAVWCLKHPAPLGPSATAMTGKYLPRPGSQFLWLYESLKYLPGGLGSIAGVIVPSIALLILISLPWLKSQRVIGAAILGAGAALVLIMTTASYVGDRRDPQIAKQLSLQAMQEQTARSEPFKATPLEVMTKSDAGGSGPPDYYVKFCEQCHGAHGEGARQGRLNFPPLIGVAAKPRRTVDDIVGLLKDPMAYGLQPPMRSFSDKLTEPQMRIVAEWIVKLQK
ncbi:MAG TPA: cytochrome b N-terminal domain-containing protein [Pyrinomonadaceae bacterium]